MSQLHRKAKFRTSRRYDALRRAVFARDKWRCRECGLPGALELHHVRPLASGGAVWDALNCQAVCRQCHIEKSARGNRREKSPTEMAWAALVGEISLDTRADADTMRIDVSTENLVDDKPSPKQATTKDDPA